MSQPIRSGPTGSGPIRSGPIRSGPTGSGPIGEEPWRLLLEWLPANDDPDRPRMTLSTVAADGAPDARTMLLSAFDRDGFWFHTDARSRKVEHLAVNPAVALTLAWEFSRQLVVLGTAEPAPADRIAAAYRARSRYLQQLAWVNSAEFALLPRSERLARWSAFERDHSGGLEPPPTWTGYLVRPHRLTFWHGDQQTASLRMEYSSTPTGWQLSLLPG